MTARILCPDDHPDRWSADQSKRGEAFASVARALRDEVLPDPKVRQVVVLVGPPGAGKSTYAKAIATVGLTVAHRVQGSTDDSVIVDACHADQPLRISLAKRIRKAGKQAIAVVLSTPVDECIRRDAQREPPRRVGEQVIRQKAAELRHYPPTRAEGWSEVIAVDHDAAASCAFVLQPGRAAS